MMGELRLLQRAERALWVIHSSPFVLVEKKKCNAPNGSSQLDNRCQVFFFLQKFENKKIFLPVTVVVFDVHLFLDLILKCRYIFKTHSINNNSLIFGVCKHNNKKGASK